MQLFLILALLIITQSWLSELLARLYQQFQIQDFDRRSSVVAQLRPLTQLSMTIKDNAKMPEIEPCAGGV
jgi:hypothetical protein